MATTAEEMCLYGRYDGVKHILSRMLEVHKAAPSFTTEELIGIFNDANEKMRPSCAETLDGLRNAFSTPALIEASFDAALTK